MPDVNQTVANGLYDWVNKGGAIAVLVAVVLAWGAGYIVTGAEYERAVKESAEWKSLTLKAYKVIDGPVAIGMAPPEVGDLKAEIESKIQD